MTARETFCQLQGLNIATLAWGEPGDMPVLALHGWLDNAASFSRLAPRLQAHVVAPDLAGHGRSDHMPDSGSYNLWDDLRYLVALVDSLGWSRFAVIGHSRGAMVGVLLAASQPDRVSHLVCIDGLAPEPVSAGEAPQQLRRHIDDFLRPSRPRRVMSLVTDAVAQRTRSGTVAADVIAPVVERNLEWVEGGVVWAWDRRLLGASALKLSAAHTDAFLAALGCPVLLCVASSGMGGLPGWRERLPEGAGLQVVEVPGSHHCHLEAAGCVTVADATNAFFKR